MTENSKRFAWVNVWMIALSAIGIWLVMSGGGQGDRYEIMQAVVPLAFVLLVGFFTTPMTFFHEARTDGRLNPNDLARLYLDALKQVFRQKWILWLLGLVLVGPLLVGVAASWLEHWQVSFSAHAGAVAWSPLFPLRIHDWMLILPEQVQDSVSTSVSRFFPGIVVGGSRIAVVFPALGVIALIIWVSVRLRTLPDEERSGRQMRLLRILLIPALLLCVAATTLAFMDAAAHYPGNKGDFTRTAWWWVRGMGVQALTALVRALFNAALIAGFGGSLLRVGRGEVVTRDSFIRDVIGFVVPVAGVYLLLTALYVALYLAVEIPAAVVIIRHGFGVEWPSIATRSVYRFMDVVDILAMFAPFVVILGLLGAWQGIRVAVREWFAHAGEVVPFVALGISFVSAALLAGNLATAVAHHSGHDPYTVPPMPVDLMATAIQTVVSMLVPVVMAVAVWEFYRRITQSDDAVQPVAHLSV